MIHGIKSNHELPPFSHYSYFYISIGSKINQHPSYDSQYQILSAFVKSQTEPTVVISIDHFTDTDQERKLEPHLPKNIDIFLYDINTEDSAIYDVLTYIVEQLEGLSTTVSKTHIFFANFIKYISPNFLEMKRETEIPKKVQSILSKRGYVLYQWFGYHPQLSSVLFRDHPMIYVYMSSLCSVLSRCRMKLDMYSVHTLVSECDTIPWVKLLRHMVDFVHTDEWGRTLDVFYTFTT